MALKLTVKCLFFVVRGISQRLVSVRKTISPVLQQDYEKQSKEKTELLNKLSVYQTDKETLAQQLLEQMNITEHSKQKHKQELEEIQEISRSHCAQSNKLTFDDNNYSISKESFHELIKTKISDYDYESKRLEVEFQDPVTQDFIEASGEFNFGLARLCGGLVEF